MRRLTADSRKSIYILRRKWLVMSYLRAIKFSSGDGSRSCPLPSKLSHATPDSLAETRILAGATRTAGLLAAGSHPVGLLSGKYAFFRLAFGARMGPWRRMELIESER